jgi:hypothetical protein
MIGPIRPDKAGVNIDRGSMFGSKFSDSVFRLARAWANPDWKPGNEGQEQGNKSRTLSRKPKECTTLKYDSRE